MPERKAHEMESGRDQRFAASRRRIQDDILAVKKFQNRIFLGFIQVDFPFVRPGKKAFEQIFGRNDFALLR